VTNLMHCWMQNEFAGCLVKTQTYRIHSARVSALSWTRSASRLWVMTPPSSAGTNAVVSGVPSTPDNSTEGAAPSGISLIENVGHAGVDVAVR